MRDRLDIGEQFALWEIATATAGALLGIDAFDQPNVQESKDNTQRLLLEYKQKGSFTEPAPSVRDEVASVAPLSGSSTVALGDGLDSALGAILGQIEPGDYVALTAFLERNAEHATLLRELRRKIRDGLKVATTVGFGPRFLHSTGQLHKGGPSTGVFLQVTGDESPAGDLAIPGMPTFGTLLRAQALGDFESLDKRRRRGARIHLRVPTTAGLRALDGAIDDALAVRA